MIHTSMEKPLRTFLSTLAGFAAALVVGAAVFVFGVGSAVGFAVGFAGFAALGFAGFDLGPITIAEVGGGGFDSERKGRV